MSGNREQVTADLVYVDRGLPGCLHSIGVEIDIGLGSDLANFLDRLHHSGFVVGGHDRDQLCIGPQGSLHVGGVDQATAIHRNRSDLNATLLQVLAGIHHRVMLDGRGDDVIAGLHEARDREIVSLGAAAGEDDFRRAASQQLGNTLPRTLDGSARLLSMVVNGRGIAEVLAEVRTHGVQHLGENRGRGVIVEINAAHCHPYLLY